VTESGNDDNDDFIGRKNQKYDPHRALNIDFNEKSIQPVIPPPSQPKEPVEIPPPVLTEKPKKSKKKKSTTIKTKQNRERSDYKELLSPADEEENRVTSTPPLEEKPKKKKTKEKKSSSKPTTVEVNNSVPLLFDIMSEDIIPTNQSHQQYNEQDVFKLAAQSDHLTIVSSITDVISRTRSFNKFRK
jgi:hypothetical protein